MKPKIILLVLLVAAIGAGAVWWVKYHSPAAAIAPGGKKILYYTCSMHPWVREKKPGPCPVCGMNLTPVYENAGGAQTGERKIKFYQSTMKPSETSPAPAKDSMGMDMIAVYENAGGAAETNSTPGTVTLESESISTINVQTDLVERRPVRRTLHLAGEISWNSATAAWFEFTAYERDLQWLKTGQILEVIVTSVPDKIYPAKIRAHGVKPFADADFDMM